VQNENSKNSFNVSEFILLNHLIVERQILSEIIFTCYCQWDEAKELQDVERRFEDDVQILAHSWLNKR